MTPAKLPFGIGERVAMRVKFADIVAGRYSQEVRLRGDVAGERRTIYLGPTSEAITSLHAGGAIATLEVPTLPPGAEAVEFPLAQRDLVLERVAVPGTRRSRLVVQLAGEAKPNGEHVTMAPPAATDAVSTKRAATLESFAAAIDVTFGRLLPIFAAHNQPVDADVAFRVAFSLWRAWIDAGVA